MVTTLTPPKKASRRLVARITDELASGRDQEEVVRALTRIDWPESRARDLVALVESRRQQQENGGCLAEETEELEHGSRGTGFLVWLGFLIVFNVLSFLCDWGWIVY